MLESVFTSVLATRTRAEFKDELIGFTKHLGFETVAVTLVIDHFLGEAEFITVDNTPKAYIDTFSDRDDSRRDPVMQHCKQHSMPIIWGQDTYVRQGQGDKWEAVSGIDSYAFPGRYQIEDSAGGSFGHSLQRGVAVFRAQRHSNVFSAGKACRHVGS